MQVSAALLTKIAKGRPNKANVASVVTSLNGYGDHYGISQPHRLAHFLSQDCHESGGFQYDQEIASGAAYEGRKDLGNTQRGDGKKFKGRTGIQITGRANYRAFTKWVRKIIPDAPDFEKNPELINTDPYEGLGPLWYWDEGNPDKKNRSLNYYADQNNIEMITRLINGGTNGFEDRINYYDRAALVLLGYPPARDSSIRYKDKKDPAIFAFQLDAHKRGDYRVDPDGETGPLTRAALHIALVKLTSSGERSKDIAKAPVVEVQRVEKKVEVPVETPVPVAVGGDAESKPFYQDPQFQKDAALGGAIPTLSAIGGLDWKMVAVLGALALAGIGIFFLIRRSRQAQVQTQTAKVEAKAATIRANM